MRPLAKLLSRCMEKEPKARFSSFDQVLKELDRLQTTDALPEVIPLGPAQSKANPTLPEVILVKKPRSERRAEPPPLPPTRSQDEVVDLPLRGGRADAPRAQRTHSDCTVKFRGHVIRAECSVWTSKATVFHDGRLVADGHLVTEGTYTFSVNEDGEQANYEVTVRSPIVSLLVKPYFTIRRNGQVLFNDR